MLREALQTTVKMEREIIDFKKELTVRYEFLWIRPGVIYFLENRIGKPRQEKTENFEIW